MAIAVLLPLVLLAAYLIGQLARLLLRGRVQLSNAVTIVISVLGISAGMLIAGLAFDGVRPWSPSVILLAVGCTTALLGIFATAAARIQQPAPRQSIATMIERGESDRLEFKSSARWNIHTSQRDERIEMVIAKAVAGFLNTGGGTLLIGVNDDGDPVGLVNDFAVVKSPDCDRYELWLRDYLASTLGQNASALPMIDFEAVTVDSAQTFLCRLTGPPSPRPVYVRHAKGQGPWELWVRTGNSTRQLKLDDAVEYVMHRWPLGMGQAAAAQLRAVVRGGGSDGR